MQKTLVILKPSAIQRGLVGEVISRFEKRSANSRNENDILTDEVLEEHYAHLKKNRFFNGSKSQ